MAQIGIDDRTIAGVRDTKAIVVGWSGLLASVRLCRWTTAPRASTRVLLGLLIPALVLAVQMWRMNDFVVDDAYISFRYARNLVAGHGLVYNPGEAIEGYTNFSWTLLVAAGIALGIDPVIAAKVVGAIAAVGLLVVCHRLSSRLQPWGIAPCLATWVLALSPGTACWAVGGLETPLFTLLVAWGVLWMIDEVGGDALPRSGLVFALAGLTRPEAPMFVGLAMLCLCPRLLGRQNLVRGALFAVPVAIHLLWRHAYYGAWVPSTLPAKTGDLAAQLTGGIDYVGGWFIVAGPLALCWCHLAARAVVDRDRRAAVCCVLPVAVIAYVVLVGGDWMPYHRFVVPAEPFVAVAVCVTLRAALERRERITTLAVAGVLVWAGVGRHLAMNAAIERFTVHERRFWDGSAGAVAAWLVDQDRPGAVAIGDIGLVGWLTDRPVLDLLGLVDPVIGALPGGYTTKLGEAYVDRFFDVAPTWAVLVHRGHDCARPAFAGVQQIVADDRFARRYRLAHTVRLEPDGAWCVFELRGAHGPWLAASSAADPTSSSNNPQRIETGARRE